jgi:predicted metalloprotease with PDZ domain
MNHDGTIYGRYGTRALADRKSLSHMSHASFVKAMQRALALHRDYPNNRSELAGKQNVKIADRFAEDMPHLKTFDWPKETKDCIHCHMIGEAKARKARLEDKLTLEHLWPYPLPETVGLRLDADDGLRVKSIRADSPAARAGLKEGDELLRMNGQPLLSQSDVQWVLHPLPTKAEVHVEVRRGGSTQQATIALEGDWRRIENTWRPTLEGIRPEVELRPGGNRRGVAPGDLDLMVNYPRGAAAAAGLRNGDTVIAIDGRKDFVTEGDFLRYLYFRTPRPQRVRMTVVRKEQQLDITLPLGNDAE